MLCELETDQVTVEVPSPVAGTMGDIIAAEGETVGVDALLATIADAGAVTAAPAKAAAAPSKAESASGGGSVDVMVPTLGESVTEATVSTWFKAVVTALPKTKCCASWKQTKSASKCPHPPLVSWPKFQRLKGQPLTPLPNWR
ncbi:SucB [Caligus rogercresseyi]|uniref:SucB n=1 Tax=Caligus rogercresseyi TaxID=217165 RepID=A0A7T8H1V2_CALRO|nr:SucB [Caligus rogercresseyi]